MYASLIGAGISQLYDLYKDVTSSTAAAKTSFKPPSADDASATGRASGPVNSSSGTGGGLSDALQKLMSDLQASTSDTGSADQTGTVADDLKSVFGKLKAGRAHGHATATGTAQDNPFTNMASSLMAYAKSQSLASSGSVTSTTA